MSASGHKNLSNLCFASSFKTQVSSRNVSPGTMCYSSQWQNITIIAVHGLTSDDAIDVDPNTNKISHL